MAFVLPLAGYAQVNTDQVMTVGKNAIYFEDYILSIQYFNLAISAKPHLAQPYFFRALAKYNLEDYQGTINDASLAIERNPFLTDAYELRAVSYQNLGEPSKAISDYDIILKTLPNNRNVLYNKALAQIEDNQQAAASESFEELLKAYPKYDAGYIGRARLRLEEGDTIGALSDADKALELNKNSVNAYLIRADVAINRQQDYAAALEDMDEAIKLLPRSAGLYINRAFLRYNLDDYYGAFSDFDYAIQLEPSSAVAYYNRALMSAQVRDYDKALSDLDKVLTLKGVDYRALYNRAIIKKEKHDFQGAIEDIDKVIEAFPGLAAGYFLRSEIRREKGDSHYRDDYNRSLELAKRTVSRKQTANSEQSTNNGKPSINSAAEESENVRRTNTNQRGNAFNDLLRDDEENQETVAARFSSLLTVDDNISLEHEYNNKSIRGKIQDRNMNIGIEPMFVVSFYNSPTELRPNPEYIKEVEDINRTHLLRFLLQVTNNEPQQLSEEEIKRHFDSVNYFNSYLSTHSPRAIDYFGRAMDFMTLRNYEEAIKDFSRAIELTPDFTMAYFMRAIAKIKEVETFDNRNDLFNISSNAVVIPRLNKARMADVIADIDEVIKLSPDMPIAHYNKGVLMMQMEDYTSALNALNKAIELKPTLGEAYYNRGYVYYMLGDKESGSKDVGKSGELGIVQSYNLLKRMNIK